MNLENQDLLMVLIDIFVKTNSRESKIVYDPDIEKYIVYVNSKPIQNQANKELTKILKKYFKAERVNIVSGLQTNKKKIDILNPKNQIIIKKNEKKTIIK